MGWVILFVHAPVISIDAVQSVARDVLLPEKAPIVIVGDTRNGSELGDWADDDDEML